MDEREQKRCAVILDAVKAKTGLDLVFVRRLESWNILTEHNGRDHVIVCYGPNVGKFTVRSLLKRHGIRAMNWFCNGQASQGCKELFFWQDDEFSVEDPCPILAKGTPCEK